MPALRKWDGKEIELMARMHTWRFFNRFCLGMDTDLRKVGWTCPPQSTPLCHPWLRFQFLFSLNLIQFDKVCKKKIKVLRCLNAYFLKLDLNCKLDFLLSFIAVSFSQTVAEKHQLPVLADEIYAYSVGYLLTLHFL